VLAYCDGCWDPARRGGPWRRMRPLRHRASVVCAEMPTVPRSARSGNQAGGFDRETISSYLSDRACFVNRPSW